jgi:hypothetical protein
MGGTTPERAPATRIARGETTLFVVKTQVGLPCYLCTAKTATIARNMRWAMPICISCLKKHGLLAVYHREVQPPSEKEPELLPYGHND